MVAEVFVVLGKCGSIVASAMGTFNLEARTRKQNYPKLCDTKECKHGVTAAAVSLVDSKIAYGGCEPQQVGQSAAL